MNLTYESRDTKYVYTKLELESMADKINAQFFPERLERALPLDPYLLLDKLGVEYEWEKISPKLEIYAMTFFEDGTWYIWKDSPGESTKTPSLACFKKGTVVVNENLLEAKKYKGTEIFAVTHEACHIIKDALFFQKNSSEIISVCFENDRKDAYWVDGKPTIEMIERQNDYLTACVIMPKKPITSEFFKAIRWKSIPKEPIKLEKYMNAGISKVAKVFGVNFNAAKYRLQDIGVILKQDN